MNAQHADYSLALGVVSAVIGLCVMLMVWYAGKTLVEDAPESAARTTVAKSKGLLAYRLSLSSSHDWISLNRGFMILLTDSG